MIRRIEINVIPHNKQRYNTCGDWQYYDAKKFMRIDVSDTGDWRDTIAVAIHELTEAVLCLDRNISQKEVDEFDIQWEKDRVDGHQKYDEPGVDPRAPYYDEHRIATIIEKMLVKKLNLKWKLHQQHLDDLDLQWGE